MKPNFLAAEEGLPETSGVVACCPAIHGNNVFADDGLF